MQDLNSIGIPINPNKHQVNRSLTSEFFEDLLLIFTSAADIVGIVFSIIHAVLFVFYWTLFLIGRFILRIDIKKPNVRKKLN